MWAGQNIPHCITVDELPFVSGSISGRNGYNGGLFEGDATGVFSYFNGQQGKTYETNGDGTSSYVTYVSAKLSFGGDKPHENRQPYQTVYIFKRTS